MTMRATDMVTGFTLSVTYKTKADALPVITAAPVRQRNDGVDYIDRSEQTAFTNGVAGIEAWLGGLIKSTLADPTLNWREEARALNER